MPTISPLRRLKSQGVVNDVAGQEGQILLQGVQLLVTALFSGIIGLIVYVWVSSRREHDRQIMTQEKRLETLEISNKDHEGRLIRIETEHINNTTCKRKS